MIEVKDVIRMRIPFPDISSTLAVKAHMYVCMEKETYKKFLKCQTSKPMHKLAHNPPFHYVEETPDLLRNPFLHTTLIDCDRFFGLQYVRVDLALLATVRRDICEDLFEHLLTEIRHPDFVEEQLDSSQVSVLNYNVNEVG